MDYGNHPGADEGKAEEKFCLLRRFSCPESGFLRVDVEVVDLDLPEGSEVVVPANVRQSKLRSDSNPWLSPVAHDISKAKIFFRPQVLGVLQNRLECPQVAVDIGKYGVAQDRAAPIEE
jgi:hypothetical protein